MKRKDSYRNNLKSAVCMTILSVILLLTTTRDIAEGRSVGVGTITLGLAVLGCGIWQWIKGTKQYIDHRLKEIEKTDLSEKIIEE